ncbi:unnamed protein product [Callosobruchus maculatus]|uniref:Uncharacterized protein n=1 Tax=Callosobruchus maculatus TaxID=64391 RepID=A0A653BGB7_CALMS|nr:unnamed protein product [Callosobruchus maculatus]
MICSSSLGLRVNAALQWMQVRSLKSEAILRCFSKCLSKRDFLTVLKVHFVHSCSLLVTDVTNSGCFLTT